VTATAKKLCSVVGTLFGITSENEELVCGFDVLNCSKLINYTKLSATVFQNITKYDNANSINKNISFGNNHICTALHNSYIYISIHKTKTKLHGLSPQANYTDQATAACWQSDCQLVWIEGATWSA
jgi:hypothetical protein